MTFRMRIAAAVAAILLVGGGLVILVGALSYQRAIFQSPADQTDAVLSRFGTTREEAIAFLRAHPESIVNDKDSKFTTPGGLTLNEVFRDVQRSAQDDAARRSRYWSVLALVLTAAAAGMAGWLIAGRAVQPVKMITTKARRASELHLNERVDYDGPTDEIGDLADTFDSMLDRLDTTFQAQRSFSGQVAHELRTPLATISSEAEFLRSAEESERTRAVDQIDAATQRADRLISALLVLARSGIGDLAQSDLELDQITGDVLGAVVNEQDWHDLRVDLSLVETPIRGDDALLRQAILNLLTNASRHNRPGGWVGVSTRVDDGWSVVSVVNSTDRPAVDVAVDVRAGENGGRPVKTGIGLTIVEAVAVAHGGQLAWHVSPANDEVRAEIRLPRAHLMAIDIQPLCDDLAAEGNDLIGLVAGLEDRGWATPTAATGWDVRDQVAHVAHFDDAARLSIADPAGFEARRPPPGGRRSIVDEAAASDHAHTGAEALDWLRRARAELVASGRTADPGARIPWYGPDMTVASSLTARIMETWAHGQDVADALGVERTPTDRLRHVAFLSARAIPNSYRAHDRPVPDDPVRVELVSPSGDSWAFGPADAVNTVRGPALDLCLVATQRRHRADTGLVAHGPVADEWLSIAQAFAGKPGAGRAPEAR